MHKLNCWEVWVQSKSRGSTFNEFFFIAQGMNYYSDTIKLQQVLCISDEILFEECTRQWTVGNGMD